MTKRRLSIAPMMGCTDRHFRYLLRLISKSAYLYTEMLTSDALIHSDAASLLQYNAVEKPLALQVGGFEAQGLANAAKLAEQHDFDEINLNVGCPSSRVQSGSFGACLFKEPHTVANAVTAMQQVCHIPVTVKTRIGVDDIDEYVDLKNFVEVVAQAGVTVFIIHARKAWLKGLSPRANRTVPPLKYDRVYQLKQDFPQLEIIINGGITTTQEVKAHLAEVDGVMLGRAAYDNPMLLVELERELFGETRALTRAKVIEQLLPYLREQIGTGTRVQQLAHHLFGLFHGIAGAKRWRRMLSGAGLTGEKVLNVMEQAAEAQLLR